MKLFVRNVVLPNVCYMLLTIGYIVFTFIYAVPQMDLIDDKHITITSGKNSEAKEIYEKIKKRLFLDNLQDLTL